MIVFSSTRSSIVAASMAYRPCAIGTSRISMSQYRANLCHTTWTGPHTMFGRSSGWPLARRLARHRHLAAIPASMHASDEPMAEAPMVLAASGAFHRSAIMCTHRRSISAACGYSSLSIMFLLTDSAIRARTSGSSHVWQNVARFCRALPSRINSSDTTWNASAGALSSRRNRYFGTGLVRSRPTNTHSDIWSRTVFRSCNGMTGILADRRPGLPPLLRVVGRLPRVEFHPDGLARGGLPDPPLAGERLDEDEPEPGLVEPAGDARPRLACVAVMHLDQQRRPLRCQEQRHAEPAGARVPKHVGDQFGDEQDRGLLQMRQVPRRQGVPGHLPCQPRRPPVRRQGQGQLPGHVITPSIHF